MPSNKEHEDLAPEPLDDENASDQKEASPSLATPLLPGTSTRPTIKNN
ncbi:hypothetical protein [Frateuria terrea]|uniref:Uncharacterized protein n=1 Tax=Frateuria terrea TaxID=529704 RepID=A0A1H6VLX8_9GAMM|nr:hypothetical protein [Frateuria terrea]SEJ05648.1 hypothetical protein SAMN04487997_2352 [Frateuria terrea]SFP70923.1 hypothetical protein SAMN02927913_3301 [Frateuria terrea]